MKFFKSPLICCFFLCLLLLTSFSSSLNAQDYNEDYGYGFNGYDRYDYIAYPYSNFSKTTWQLVDKVATLNELPTDSVAAQRKIVNQIKENYPTKIIDSLLYVSAIMVLEPGTPDSALREFKAWAMVKAKFDDIEVWGVQIPVGALSTFQLFPNLYQLDVDKVVFGQSTRKLLAQMETITQDAKQLDATTKLRLQRHFAIKPMDNMLYANLFVETNLSIDTNALRQIHFKAIRKEVHYDGTESWKIQVPIQKIAQLKQTQGISYVAVEEVDFYTKNAKSFLTLAQSYEKRPSKSKLRLIKRRFLVQKKRGNNTPPLVHTQLKVTPKFDLNTIEKMGGKLQKTKTNSSSQKDVSLQQLTTQLPIDSVKQLALYPQIKQIDVRKQPVYKTFVCRVDYPKFDTGSGFQIALQIGRDYVGARSRLAYGFSGGAARLTQAGFDRLQVNHFSMDLAYTYLPIQSKFFSFGTDFTIGLGGVEIPERIFPVEGSGFFRVQPGLVLEIHPVSNLSIGVNAGYRYLAGIDPFLMANLVVSRDVTGFYQGVHLCLRLE
ncbi:MAG: hypothetical protein ACPGXL_02765 [Chitinophagales bacterium]